MNQKFDVPDYYSTIKYSDKAVLALDDDDDEDNDLVLIEPQSTEKKFLDDDVGITLNKNQMSRIIESLTSSIMCSNS